MICRFDSDRRQLHSPIASVKFDRPALFDKEQGARWRRKPNRLPGWAIGQAAAYPEVPAMKIVSGGQSGVDRAALDTAIALGLACGGWCPRGGWAEDFPDPPGLLVHYPQLVETPSAEPAERTRRNVRDSDATLILVDRGGMAAPGGTQLANAVADELGKPWLALDLAAPDGRERLRGWLTVVKPDVLSIGGPRESEAPGLYEKARTLLGAVLGGE